MQSAFFAVSAPDKADVCKHCSTSMLLVLLGFLRREPRASHPRRRCLHSRAAGRLSGGIQAWKVSIDKARHGQNQPTLT